jgi:type II secretory pathway predicted ATPase ExeA
MYKTYYGLQARPFSLRPDPAFFFHRNQYETASALLDYAALHQAGIMVLTGDAGCGKTSLVHHFQHSTRAACAVGIISNPVVLREVPLRGILHAFNLSAASGNETELYITLQCFLQQQRQAQRTSILIIDEAQNLSPATLEELRLLTNSEVGSAAMLQLILVGQPELEAILNRPELARLQQRIVSRYHLHALNKQETVTYITHRLIKARSPRVLFTQAAMSRVYWGSGGIPRLINMLCDIALTYGYAENLHKIDEDTVNQVIADRRFVNCRLRSAQMLTYQAGMPTDHLQQDNTKLIHHQRQANPNRHKFPATLAETIQNPLVSDVF